MKIPLALVQRIALTAVLFILTVTLAKPWSSLFFGAFVVSLASLILNFDYNSIKRQKR